MSTRDAGPRPTPPPTRKADPRAQRDGGGDDGVGSGISAPEWVVAALGLALVVAVVWMLLAEALGGPATPPDVEVRVTDTRALDAGHLVRFEARNDGDGTAAALSIEGELTLPGGERETAHVQLDYLPGHSKREGGLIFRHDPRRGTVVVRATGFVEP